MKKLKFLLFLNLIGIITLSMFSCSNEEDTSVQTSNSDQKKVEKMMRLYESYGWELDTTVSKQELEKGLLKMDYEKTKTFLNFMKGGWEMDSTVQKDTISPEQSHTRAIGGTPRSQSYDIHGTHSSAVGSSTTRMDLSYNLPSTTSVTIVGTSVSSNPASTWSPDKYESFNFSGTKCDVKATGRIKSSFYSHTYEMLGWVSKDNGGRLIDGKITGFHEN